MISTSEINILNQTGFHLSLKTKAYLKHQEIEKKIFTQLPVYTQASNYQPNMKILPSNTIEIYTKLYKSVA